VKEWLDLDRNHYDRLGHIMQGLVPALVCREVLVRNRVVSKRGWLGFLVVCFSMAVSACYELVEWITAEISEEAAESFLGTQGDGWDTQKDMACALLGALVAVMGLRVPHDRAIRSRERAG
jgi:putative membrane protein